MAKKPPQIETRKITDFTPDPSNANLGTERGLRILDDSLASVGLGRSVVADKNGLLIAGNKTQERSIDSGFEDALVVHTDGKQLVVVQRDDLDLLSDDPNNPARKMAYFDNVASQHMAWDAAQIAADIEAGVDLSAMFTPLELDDVLAGLRIDSPTPDPGAQMDRAAELQQKWQVKRGDLWMIGKHRLLCGDSTNAEDTGRLCPNKIQGVFTSPPYAEQRKDQYGGIAADKYVQWWGHIQFNIRSVLKDDGNFFINIKPHSEEGERSLYVMDLVLAMSREWRWSFVDEFCWLRSGVPREVKYSFKNGFEPIYQFAAKRKKFKFRPDAVRHQSDSVPIPGGKGVGNTNWAGKQGNKARYGDAASDLQGHSSWIFGGQDYAPGLAYPSNVLKGFSNDETRGHEAAFPVQLPDFFIRAYSDPDDIWYDPFMGSGTMFVAAEQNQRVARGMEMKPEYCAVILERMAGMGLTPHLEGQA